MHSLGNLVLTYDNSAYGRKCFKEKKGRHLAADMPPVKCYAQAPLRQEQRLALYSEWTPETITARQRELAEWAIRRWSVQSPNDAVIADEDAEIEPEGNDDDQLSRLALSGFDTGAPPLWGIIGD